MSGEYEVSVTLTWTREESNEEVAEQFARMRSRAIEKESPFVDEAEVSTEVSKIEENK